MSKSYSDSGQHLPTSKALSVCKYFYLLCHMIFDKMFTKPANVISDSKVIQLKLNLVRVRSLIRLEFLKGTTTHKY